MLSKRITLRHHPIQNQAWSTNLGIRAITLDFVLDDGGLPTLKVTSSEEVKATGLL
jgi:hypothetical protein